jgi:hypothetical protein
MKFLKSASLPLVVALVGTPLIAARAARDRDEGPRRDFVAQLKGPNEVPLTLSAARGTLRLTVNDTDSAVHFDLEYQGLQTTVLFSHIHVGQPNVNGAVTVFFCGGGGRPACPQSGTVTGDFVANDVGAITSQQLDSHDLALLLKAIRAGETYANVHTMTSPGGEIRGQIRAADDRD